MFLYENSGIILPVKTINLNAVNKVNKYIMEGYNVQI